MRLIETWLADQERAFDLFAKFPAEETGFENPAAGMNRERFAAYVRGLRDESLGVGLPDGWVPATKYILVNDEGDYVGIFNLRHRLTDFLRNGPGHIGYGVAREYRRSRLRDRRAQAHACQGPRARHQGGLPECPQNQSGKSCGAAALRRTYRP